MTTLREYSRVYSGTDYLGTSADPHFHSLIEKSIHAYGSHYGGSRWANNCPPIFDECEEYLAAYFGVEKSILFSSGSIAGFFAQKLALNQESIFYSGDLHPALVSTIEKGISFETKEELHQKCANVKGKVALLFNAINPSTVEEFSFDWVNDLPDQNEYLLILDDSHGIGLIGEQGLGVLSRIKELRNNMELIIVASLGKSFGLPGGLMLGKSSSLSLVKLWPQWGGASPPSPFVPDLLLSSMEYYTSRRKVLKQKISLFNDLLEFPGQLKRIVDFPVYLVRNVGWYEHLMQKGFQISAFSYPDPKGERIERIVINAGKNDRDIRELAIAINQMK